MLLSSLSHFGGMRISPFPVLFPPFEEGPDLENFRDVARDGNRLMLYAKGVKPSEKTGIWLVDIASASQSATGILCLTSMEDYREGKLQPHEATLASRLDDQRAFLSGAGHFVKPVMVAHPDAASIAAWTQSRIDRPPDRIFKLTTRQESYRFWYEGQPGALKEIQDLFLHHVLRAAIADGHHRCAAAADLSASGVKTFDRIPAAYFPLSQLKIHAFHRVYSLLSAKGIEWLQQLSSVFHLSPLPRYQPPRCKGEFLLGFDRQWYLGATGDNPEGKPDAMLLEERFFSNLDPREILSIRFPEDNLPPEISPCMEGLCTLVFNLFPVPKEDWMASVNRHWIFPPKSTRFTPAYRSGLTMFDLS